MPAGKGRFIVGAKGTHGCDGYPVVGGEGKVHGCHPTRAAAVQQQSAIYAAQAREAKKSSESTWTGFFYPELTKATDIMTAQPEMESESENQGYQGCGCETCKALNVDCPDCPVCRQGDANDADMEDKGMKIPSPVTTPVNNTEITTIKRDYSTSARERMAESDQAMPDGSFPIANASDLRNAIQSVGRAKDYNAAKQHIIRRARALGLVDQLPEDWKKNVRKTNWGGSVFDLNPFVK